MHKYASPMDSLERYAEIVVAVAESTAPASIVLQAVGLDAARWAEIRTYWTVRLASSAYPGLGERFEKACAEARAARHRARPASMAESSTIEVSAMPPASPPPLLFDRPAPTRSGETAEMPSLSRAPVLPFVVPSPPEPLSSPAAFWSADTVEVPSLPNEGAPALPFVAR